MMTKQKKQKGINNPLTNNLWQAVRKNWVAWLLILPALLCLYFKIVRPQIYGIIWSFADMQGYTVKGFAGFDNYLRVFNDKTFLKILWNTVQYVFWSLVVGYALPILIAVLLNEVVHLRGFFRISVYLPSVLPGVGVMLMWYLIFYPDASGLLNSILATVGMEPYTWLQDEKWVIFYIVLTMTWSGCGATAIYYFASLQGVNRELYEAAIVDGAGVFRRFCTVTFPHISGIALLFLVKQIIGVFSVMEQPMQMTDGGPNNASMTLGLLAYKHGFISMRPQLAMAVGNVMFIILLIFTLFYFKLNKKVEDNLY